VKHTPHAGYSNSRVMESAMAYDPRGHAEYTSGVHARRRGALPPAARRIPKTEVVLGQPLVAQDRLAVGSIPDPAPEGKRSVYGGKMPYEALRAAKTSIGPEELGGAGAPTASPVRSQPSARGYEDHSDMLHYSEHADDLARDGRAYNAVQPPPRHPSAVAESMTCDVAPSTVSNEPKGLPKRHPGAERLRRGRGVDGEGHDHLGRQLATSLVDEAIFQRSAMHGKIPLANQGANFHINVAGEFAHR
jgi:hypothetical protein